MSKLLQDKHAIRCFIACALALLSLVSFIIMVQTTPYEASEQPAKVIVLSAVCALLAAAAGIRNLFHVPGAAAFALAVLTFFTFISGRVSYLAFYFSGDAMATGFSPMFAVTAVLMLAGVVVSAIALFAEKA